MRQKSILVIMVFTLIIVLPTIALATNTSEYSIEPLGGIRVWWTLQGDETVSGSILISHKIKFSITDPDGFILEDYGTIEQTTPFEFVATRAGNYTLRFQSLSLDETKVKVSYDIEKPSIFPEPVHITPRPSLIDSETIQVLLGITFICVAIALVYVSFVLGKKRSSGKPNSDNLNTTN